MTSKSDIQVASLAAGFTLGFGFLTVWEAIKQTRRNRNPLRSTYIYMMWGEILANLVIGIMGWLFLDGILGPTYVEHAAPAGSKLTFDQGPRLVLHSLPLGV
jgi:hypothetical protein